MIKNFFPPLFFPVMTLLLDVMGLALSNPIIPKLINQFQSGNTSTSAYYFGLITTAYALMIFVFSPILGGLSDWFGRKPLLLCSLVGTLISYLILTFAPDTNWIFIAQIIDGTTGASVAVVFAYVADISSPEQRAKNFGMLGATFGVAWIIGPALGGIMGSWNLRSPFVVAALLTFLNLLYGLIFVPESHKIENRRRFNVRNANPCASMWLLRKNSTTISLSWIIVCNDLAVQCFISTWVLFTSYKFKWTTIEVGTSLALLGVVTALVMAILIQTMISRFGERKTIIIGLTSSLIGYLLYAVASEGWMIYLIIFLNGFDFVVKPTAQGLLSNQLSSQEQGMLSGALASLAACTSVIGPLVATNLFGYFIGTNAPFHFPEVALILGSLLFGIALWKARSHEPVILKSE